MTHKMSYKNEKIFALSVDLLVMTICLSITYILFEYPHVFSYFKEVEAAKEIINPQSYMAAMDQLNQRFDYLIFEIAAGYFLYESFCLLVFRQTLGRKAFHQKVYLNFDSSHDTLLRMAIIPARTLVKILSVLWMIPSIVIGICFFFGKKNKTIIDTIFLTVTR